MIENKKSLIFFCIVFEKDVKVDLLKLMTCKVDNIYKDVGKHFRSYSLSTIKLIEKYLDEIKEEEESRLDHKIGENSNEGSENSKNLEVSDKIKNIEPVNKIFGDRKEQSSEKLPTNLRKESTTTIGNNSKNLAKEESSEL